MSLSDFPSLGFGVGLRRPHYSQFWNGRPEGISWVEAISENYMHWKDGIERRSTSALERVRGHLPVVLHGVSLSFGSVDPVDPDYLARLKALVRRIEPAWVSDHLCWTGSHGQNMHDLLPLPYNEEALALVARKVEKVQTALGRRILLENVSSYLEFSFSEMTEWEFLVEVARRADCGILLDVNNIYVSSVNHGFDPYDYLDAVPEERVVQMHLAGHSDMGDHLIDTHDEPVCDEVWSLYRDAARRFPHASTMVEWDEKIPEWPVLEAEVRRAESIWHEVQDGRNSALGAPATL